MVVVSVRLSPRVALTKRRMAYSATPYAGMASTVSVLSAGSTAPLNSETMARSATNHLPMVAEWAMPFGTKTSARGTTLSSVAKNGAPFGILNARPASITSHAASAPLIALPL